MNERIRELSAIAKNLTTDDAIHLSRIHNRTLSLDELGEIFEQKFAELLIRECITQCEQVATDANAMTKSKFVTDAGLVLHEGAWGGAKNCSEQIKLHFGVEE